MIIGAVNKDESVECALGKLPSACDECCHPPEPECPEMKVCTSKCVTEEFESYFHMCLHDKLEKTTTECEEICIEEVDTGCPLCGHNGSPDEDDCPELLDCQSKCTTEKIKETFDGCLWAFDKGDSHECQKECKDIYPN